MDVLAGASPRAPVGRSLAAKPLREGDSRHGLHGKEGITRIREMTNTNQCNGAVVGEYAADLVVENKVIVMTPTRTCIDRKRQADILSPWMTILFSDA